MSAQQLGLDGLHHSLEPPAGTWKAGNSDAVGGCPGRPSNCGSQSLHQGRARSSLPQVRLLCWTRYRHSWHMELRNVDS